MANNLVQQNSSYLKNRFGQTRPGLQYNGYNSFRNASIQALFACEEFRIKVLLISNRYPDLYTYHYLYNYFVRMAMGTEEIIATQLSDRIEVNNEIDPSLYLMGLLDNLRLDYESVPQIYGSDVAYSSASEVFCRSFQLECDGCQRTITRVQRDSIIILECDEFDPNNTTEQLMVMFQCYAINDYNVGQSIGLCKQCGKDLQIIRSIAPNILVMSIVENEDRFKISVYVDDKDFSAYGYEYSIVACICHDGVNTEEDYYCCYARIGNKWYYYRDSIVREILVRKLNQKLLAKTCIVFYQKQALVIPKNVIQEVNSLIPKIFSVPEKYYEESEDTNRALDEQQISLRTEPYMTGADLIGATIGHKHGLYNRGEGVCYMNSALQALFHCEAFRLHILVGKHSGRFHTLLRRLFEAMAGFTGNLSHECDNFFKAFSMNVRKEFYHTMGSLTEYFLLTLLDELNSEVKLFTERKSDYFSDVSYGTKVNTSREAWMQLMDRQHNSYIYQLFAIQRKSVEKCLNGHINSIDFSHTFIDLIKAPNILLKNSYDLQEMLDRMKPSENSENCSQCTQNKSIFYEYSSISRVSNIIIFELGVVDKRDSGSVSDEVTIFNINEMLTVCSQTYYCQAICVGETIIGVGEHAYTYAKVDNDWWCFNDFNVSQVSTGCMLDENLYKSRYKHVDLVFYQKLSPSKRSKLTESDEKLFKLLKPLEYSPKQIPEN